jgi:hypothetical protein
MFVNQNSNFYAINIMLAHLRIVQIVWWNWHLLNSILSEFNVWRTLSINIVTPTFLGNLRTHPEN